MRGYATNDYRGDFANASTPIAIFAGGDDELMYSDKYAEAIQGFESKVTLHTIPGTNHMAIVSGQTALAAIAADVAAN
jgi:pimeloyl-ACP methyl ester carboxylesterase